MTSNCGSCDAGFQKAQGLGKGAPAHLGCVQIYSPVSIVSNIAEGCGRAGRPDFARFLQIATGSASELEYQLLLARDLNFLKPEEYQNLGRGVVEVKRMLSSLTQRLRGET